MTAMTSPRNTSKPDVIDAVGVLFGGGIEAQERQGQQQLLKSTTLPTDMGDEAPYLELGFTFGAVVDGDPLFREATLPQGWGRQGSDHAMWSDVIDERGIRRVGVFYKAAFYDRKAHMGLVNVGGDIATQFIYGDDAQPVLHAELTDAELAEARARAEEYVAKGTERPDSYGDLMPRAQKLIEALDAHILAGRAR